MPAKGWMALDCWMPISTSPGGNVSSDRTAFGNFDLVLDLIVDAEPLKEFGVERPGAALVEWPIELAFEHCAA